MLLHWAGAVPVPHRAQQGCLYIAVKPWAPTLLNSMVSLRQCTIWKTAQVFL